jgi:hypothetical protein
MSDSSEDEYDAEAAEQIEETEEIKTFAELVRFLFRLK